jgi:hypothetical protein
MVIVIFFGGILLGFLLGFSSMAVLSAMNHRLECREFQEVPVYQQVTPRQES